jgi:hypothetical protein
VAAANKISSIDAAVPETSSSAKSYLGATVNTKTEARSVKEHIKVRQPISAGAAQKVGIRPISAALLMGYEIKR